VGDKKGRPSAEMVANYLKEMLMKPYLPKALTICPRRFWT
jgi:hypothetical protein